LVVVWIAKPDWVFVGLVGGFFFPPLGFLFIVALTIPAHILYWFLRILAKRVGTKDAPATAAESLKGGESEHPPFRWVGQNRFEEYPNSGAPKKPEGPVRRAG
jgi:hypothetical protein